MSLMHEFLAAAHDDAQRLTSTRAYMQSLPQSEQLARIDRMADLGSIEHDSAPQQQRLGFQRMPRARGERQLKCE
ncbi:hypothetical protein NHJ13051_000905 [Beauveria bassiana]